MNEFDETALAWMREMILATLPQRATLFLPIISTDEAGGQTETWQQVASDVPCRINAMRHSADRWQLFDDAPIQTGRYWAVFVDDAPLTGAMRMLIDGMYYRVVSMSRAHGAKLVIHATLETEIDM